MGARRAAGIICRALSARKSAAFPFSVAGKCHDGAGITRAAQGEAQAAAPAPGRGHPPPPPWHRLGQRNSQMGMFVDAGLGVKGVRGRAWRPGWGGGNQGAGPYCMPKAGTPQGQGAVGSSARSMATASDPTITPQKRIRARAQLESKTRKTVGSLTPLKTHHPPTHPQTPPAPPSWACIRSL